MKYLIFLSLFSLFMISCKPTSTPEQESEQTTAPSSSSRKDFHSFANPEEAKTTHLSLDLKVDFDAQILTGYAKFNIENNNANKINFDTRSLTIKQVTIGEEEQETTFNLSKPVPFKGQALVVDIKPTTKVVTIYYETTPDAAALDWLNPQQSADKQHPFLFTQGQAILTRTWIPCQDSPGIRITYDATIQVPVELMAVMSASNPQEKNDTGEYTFKMEQPIPPYLLALAVGDLNFAAIGPRTGVYAEPSVIDDAVNEFADMEKMLVAAEDLYGEYLWERYDVIVLPPSFPFGGMENPRLTFATPTIIAGDRSLTALIAHELAHSWSGNLVTNATWNDFWLNEGFTVYFERRIMEALYGEDYVNMLALLGYQDLQEEVKDLGAESDDTKLLLSLENRDPDDGMTNIAYEKGAFFLTYLEKKAGRENFDQFLKTYFDAHKFKTITTAEFIEYLKTNLIERYDLEVNIDQWINQPGIPETIPAVHSDRFQKVDGQIKDLLDSGDVGALATDEWTTHEWLHFIRHLPRELNPNTMKALDETFELSDSGNSEIAAAWYELAIYNGYSDVILPKIEAFLVEVGRRKFLTPIYRALKNTDQLEMAKAIFEKAKPNYHSVSSGSIAELLGK